MPNFLSNIMQINFLVWFSVISCNRHRLLKVTQFAKNHPIWSPCLMLLYPIPGVYSAETFRTKNHTIRLLDVWFLWLKSILRPVYIYLFILAQNTCCVLLRHNQCYMLYMKNVIYCFFIIESIFCPILSPLEADESGLPASPQGVPPAVGRPEAALAESGRT
jgi:hypothetical protein